MVNFRRSSGVCYIFLLLFYAGKSIFINVGVLLICLLAKNFFISLPIVDCLAFFYAGGLSAISYKYFKDKGKINNLHSLAFLVVCIQVALFFKYDIFSKSYLTIFFMLSMCPALLVVAAIDMPFKPGLQRIIETAGNMTYSSYLCHYPIQLGIALFCIKFKYSIPYYNPYFFIAYLCTTLAAANFVYKYFELPAQQLIRQHFNGRKNIPRKINSNTV